MSSFRPPWYVINAPQLLAGAIMFLTFWRLWVIGHSGMTLYVDEAYYWGWAQELDWGYFSKPPLVAALIAATTQVFGDGIAGVKAGALICYPATAVALFGLGRRLYGTTTGLIAALAFLTLPITSALGLFVSTDALLLFFWVCALWALDVALARNRLIHWVLLGVACGLGLMSKYTMAGFAPTVLVMMLATPEGRTRLRQPGPWVAALVALAIFAPNIWWNAHHDFPTFRHTADITNLGGAGEHAKPNPLEFLGAQIGSFGPLLAIGFFGALFSLRSRWRNPADRLLIAGTLPLFLVVTAQSLVSRANANWAGPIFCAGTLLAVVWLQGSALRRKLLAVAIVFNLLVTGVVYHWPQVLALSGRPLTGKLDPLKRMKGWEALAQGVAPFIAANPDAYLVSDERTLLAHMAYALRNEHPRIASWNDDYGIHDQYSLTHSLPDHTPADVLYLATYDIPGVTRRFASAEKLAEITVRRYPDEKAEDALHVSVWHLRGFKGYHADTQ